MIPKQKVRITYNDTESFFFDYNFKTALQHADDFIQRNKNKFDMKVYLHTNKPKPFPRWEFFKEHLVNKE
jgi:hypothetical protein